MKRDLSPLAHRRYDLAVIGAGVHGAAIAAVAATCGLSVVLLEKGDFCGQTSANSLKILHGGLRYLQHFDLQRVRDSIASRRWMMANFPEVVDPLECILLTSGHGLRSKPVMRLGLAVNDLFSWFRNRGLREDKQLGFGRTLPLAVCHQIIAGLENNTCSGGALWFDGFAQNTERIVLDLVHVLTDWGGTALNYVEVQSIRASAGRVEGLQCRDREQQALFYISAATVVNATGARLAQYGVDSVATQAVSGWSKAVNLVLNRPLFERYAVGLEGTGHFVDKDALIQKGKRLFFFVPWRQKTLVGTVYTFVRDVEREAELSRQEIVSILEEINQVYPASKLRFSDVGNYHVGYVPCRESTPQGAFDVRLDKKEMVLDHGERGGCVGLYSIKTVKFTTAFTLCRDFLTRLYRRGLIAERVWKNRCREQFALSHKGGQQPDLPPWLLLRWGKQAAAVASGLSSDWLHNPQAANTIAPEEIRFAVKKEMALHLDDLLFRRTGLAAEGLPDDTTLKASCQSMGKLLHWDDATCSEELARVQKHFAPLSE